MNIEQIKQAACEAGFNDELEKLGLSAKTYASAAKKAAGQVDKMTGAGRSIMSMLTGVRFPKTAPIVKGMVKADKSRLAASRILRKRRDFKQWGMSV